MNFIKNQHPQADFQKLGKLTSAIKKMTQGDIVAYASRGDKTEIIVQKGWKLSATFEKQNKILRQSGDLL